MTILFFIEGDLVPGNSHFDTTKGHIEFRKATPVDCTADIARDLTALHPFKGNVDLVKKGLRIIKEAPILRNFTVELERIQHRLCIFHINHFLCSAKISECRILPTARKESSSSSLLPRCSSETYSSSFSA